jgi:endonuclease III
VPVLDLVASLERFYGPLAAPPFDPFRCFVWETLGTQATPMRRDMAYSALRRIPALTPDAMFRAPRARLAAAVALAGPYQEQRISALLAGVAQFRRRSDLASLIQGRLRDARRAIQALPRLADASVGRLLLFGGNHMVMPVDREMVRLCLRLGLDSGPERASAAVARGVRRAIHRALPPDVDVFRRASLYLNHHAAQTCTDDPHCVVCPLNEQCPSAQT